MKDTFKAIQFDRKQRVAFLVILVLIFIGSVVNIKGFTTDKKQMEDVINLDDVITQKYYYKKYYQSKYKKSYSSNKSSGSPSKGNKGYSDNNNSINQTKEKNNGIDPAANSRVIDTISQVTVPDDYTLVSNDSISDTEKAVLPFTLSAFDPNVATKDDLMLMYLPEKWIDNIIAYRSKGGIYRQNQDVKKLYTTTDALYNQVEPYLNITDEGIYQLEEKQALADEAANQAWLEEVILTSQFLEINTLNEETLIKLPKVTPALARKINKYKHLLGGYYQLEQLLEVYDMEASIYDAIVPYLICDPIIEVIDINADDLTRLNRHPYIGYKKTKVIMRYRNQHGKFDSVDGFKKVGVWNSEEFAKLKPYLSVGK